MAVTLIEGEKVLKKTCPHFLAMISLYLCWLYIGGLGLVAIIFRPQIMNWIARLPFGKTSGNVVYLLLWSLLLIIPALTISFIRINWYWLLFGGFICVAGILLYVWRADLLVFFNIVVNRYPVITKASFYIKKWWPFAKPVEHFFTISEIANYWLIIVGAFGFLMANSYRRSHHYYITNRRIIARFGSLIIRERDLLYSKVDDLIIHQNFIGMLFNFGTLIPISASGIGTGSDEAMLAVGGEQKLPFGPTLKVTIGGGRSVTVPRAPSFYSLYGVSKPEILKNIMLKEMEQREYGYTRRQNEAGEII